MEPVLVAEAMLERPGVRALLARERDEAAAADLRSAGHGHALEARGPSGH
jgi:hypothetical protein